MAEWSEGGDIYMLRRARNLQRSPGLSVSAYFRPSALYNAQDITRIFLYLLRILANENGRE